MLLKTEAEAHYFTEIADQIVLLKTSEIQRFNCRNSVAARVSVGRFINRNASLICHYK